MGVFYLTNGADILARFLKDFQVFVLAVRLVDNFRVGAISKKLVN